MDGVTCGIDLRPLTLLTSDPLKVFPPASHSVSHSVSFSFCCCGAGIISLLLVFLFVLGASLTTHVAEMVSRRMLCVRRRKKNLRVYLGDERT